MLGVALRDPVVSVALVVAFSLGNLPVHLSSTAGMLAAGRRYRYIVLLWSAIAIHTHCPTQQLYFDDEGLLRRHDYEVDVAGGTLAAHLVSDYVEVQGLRLPTRRRVFMRNGDGTFAADRLLVSVDLSDFELTRVGDTSTPGGL